MSVAGPAVAEFVEKKSRFVAEVAGVASETEASAFLESVRGRHPGASHCAWAYVVGLSGQHQRASDDGEPQGTAGRPILEVILRQGVVNAIVVVARYFGGILLGAGGLVRAYSHAAKLGLDKAGTAQAAWCARVSFPIEYSLFGAVQRELERRGMPVDRTDFGSEVTVETRLRAEDLIEFSSWLTDMTNGSCRLEVVDEFYNPTDPDGRIMP